MYIYMYIHIYIHIYIHACIHTYTYFYKWFQQILAQVGTGNVPSISGRWPRPRVLWGQLTAAGEIPKIRGTYYGLNKIGSPILGPQHRTPPIKLPSGSEPVRADANERFCAAGQAVVRRLYFIYIYIYMNIDMRVNLYVYIHMYLCISINMLGLPGLYTSPLKGATSSH